MRKLFAVLATVAAMAVPAALHANPLMTGQFTLQGTVTDAGNVLTFPSNVIMTGNGTQTGSFATILSDNELITAGTNVIGYNPYVADSAFFDIGSLSALFNTLTETTQIINNQTVHDFVGTLDLAAPGFANTPATFTFSTQGLGVIPFSAIAAVIPPPTPSPVPEPSSLILLGTGILGIAAVARRKLLRF